MVHKKNFYFIAFLSVALIFVLVCITDAVPYAYITNQRDNTVSVIDTATNIVNNMGVGNGPASFGQFIEKLTPTITWNNPANLTYGTTLSSNQLDASASDSIS
jgi:YVTN family beta-propeller protein